MQTQVLCLTADIVKAYWMGKPEKFLNHLHPDVFWIGSVDSEYVRGAEEVKKRIWENIGEITEVNLKNEEYQEIYSDAKTCTIVGKYTAYTKPETGYLLSEKQRVTFQWVLAGGEYKIIHLHLSNVLHIQSEDEKFPVAAGKQTFEYMKNLLKHQKEIKKISLKDTSGRILFVPEYEIEYIKADGNYVNVCCEDQTIHCRDTLKHIGTILPGYYVSVGRSCIVNVDNIKEIENGKIKMQSGSMIELPVKNIKEITAKIKNNLFL